MTRQLTTSKLVQFVELLVTHIFIRKFSKPQASLAAREHLVMTRLRWLGTLLGNIG